MNDLAALQRERERERESHREVSGSTPAGREESERACCWGVWTYLGPRFVDNQLCVCQHVRKLHEGFDTVVELTPLRHEVVLILDQDDCGLLGVEGAGADTTSRAGPGHGGPQPSRSGRSHRSHHRRRRRRRLAQSPLSLALCYWSLWGQSKISEPELMAQDRNSALSGRCERGREGGKNESHVSMAPAPAPGKIHLSEFGTLSPPGSSWRWPTCSF